MKATMLSKQEMDYAQYHLHDGLEKTVEGLNQLLKLQRISLAEHDELMQKAITRHLTLWRAFTSKLMTKSLSVLFAGLFLMMQISGDDLQMRRSSRTRTSNSRTARARSGSRSGRRRNEDCSAPVSMA